jgi:hypothetical protein
MISWLKKSEQAMQAQEDDVLSDREDEQFGASDDSDNDPDYTELPDTVTEDSCDDGADPLANEDKKLGPSPLLHPGVISKLMPEQFLVHLLPGQEQSGTGPLQIFPPEKAQSIN